MTDSSKYVLRVTAGPTYEDQKEIQVNTEKAYRIKSEKIDAGIKVRIKNFRGIPKSPSTSPYFTHKTRSHALYSLEFDFKLPTDISANDLVLGNDFDHPIKDRLPPLFGQAFGYVKKWIDPGLEGDPYADEPYLYGRVVGSVNTFRVGEKGDVGDGGRTLEGKKANDDGEDDEDDDEDDDVSVVEEGADGNEAEKIREDHQIPSTGSARQKFFLKEEARKSFTFEKGRRYSCDFFNGYLDFDDFSLRLPLGLSISVVRHWDGQPLRYVLRNLATKELLFCVSFNLVPVDEESRRIAEEQTGKKIGVVGSEKDKSVGDSSSVQGGQSGGGGDDDDVD